MKYCRYAPAFPLSDYVSCLWYSEGFAGTHALERLLPNGEAGIVFDLREREFHGAAGEGVALDAPAVFCGARTDSFVLETSAQERVIGIQFRAGGAFPFLAMPVCEVSGAMYALEDAWGWEAGRLRERLLDARGMRAMFGILEQALMERFERCYALHPVVSFAVGQLSRVQDATRVADVTAQIGMSARRFGDLFREQTGLTPKAFHCVRRFQQVLERLRGRRDENWASLAADCGYYDQAHFIHDFRRFSGVTPGEYLLVATPHLNHLPLE